MKISIITVCYNSAATIRDTITSVLSQNYNNIEYIIVDGASTDNTLSIINEYKADINRIIREPDQGLYDAINKGIRVATGDVIGLLHADDFYENNDSLESIAEHFINKPEADLVFGDVVFVKSDNLEKITRYYNSKNFKSWKLRFGWMPPHPATFIRKTAYQKAGLYSLQYKISADYEMLVRLLLVKKLKYSRLDEVLIRMRTGGISSAGIHSNAILNKEIVKACKDNGIYTNIFFVLTKVPFKLLELLHKPKQVSA